MTYFIKAYYSLLEAYKLCHAFFFLGINFIHVWLQEPVEVEMGKTWNYIFSEGRRRLNIQQGFWYRIWR